MCVASFGDRTLGLPAPVDLELHTHTHRARSSSGRAEPSVRRQAAQHINACNQIAVAMWFEETTSGATKRRKDDVCFRQRTKRKLDERGPWEV